MAKDILAVYDSCQSYVERFVCYAHRKHKLWYEIEGYSDLTILMEHLRNNKIKAVLFSQEEIKLQEGERRTEETLIRIKDEKDVGLIILGEQPAAGFDPHTGMFIEKYQSMELILAQLDVYMKELLQKEGVKVPPEKLRVDGLYSPADKRSHPKTAAILAGKQKGDSPEMPAKTLYINLEQFSGLGNLAGESGYSGISDVIYYYKTDPAHLGTVLRRVKGSYMGMDVLTAPAEIDDLEEIGKQGWPDFLSALSQAGDYPYILIDMSVFQKKLFEVIIGYGNLYIPALPYPDQDARSVLTARNHIARERETAAEKLREFRQYIEDTVPQEWMERIMEIHMA